MPVSEKTDRRVLQPQVLLLRERGGRLFLLVLPQVPTYLQDLFLDRVREIYPIRANCFQEDPGAASRLLKVSCNVVALLSLPR